MNFVDIKQAMRQMSRLGVTEIHMKQRKYYELMDLIDEHTDIMYMSEEQNYHVENALGYVPTRFFGVEIKISEGVDK
jgi:hypothetical protein